MTGLLVGLVAAFSLHGIYLILGSRRDEITKGVRYVEVGQVIGYQSISDFMSARNSRYIAFLLFRTIPVIVVLILAMGFIDKHSGDTASKWVAIAAFLLVNLGLTFFPRKKLLPFKSVRLVFALLTVLNLILSITILAISLIWDLSIFSLDLEALIGDLAAALIAAILVVFYLKSTDMSPKHMRSKEQQAFETNEFVTQRGELIGHQYDNLIHTAAAHSGADPKVLLSILIYEDLNRPAPIRWLENLLVRIPGVVLTVGIAQVRSKKPLTDEESINEMGNVLADIIDKQAVTSHYYPMYKMLMEYNGDSEYADNVLKIYWQAQHIDF